MMKLVNEYLSILNEDYKKYLENTKDIMQEVDKRIIRDTGLSLKGFAEEYIQ